MEARSHLVLISLLALMVASCAEATPTPTSIPPTVAPTPTATVTVAPIPTLTVTSVPPGPTATARPVPTPEPSPTDPAFPTEAPTSEPTAAPTKTPAPTATPRTGEPASDRGGLWAGEENASPGHLAFGLTPGARPDVDPWRFESAPSFPLSITCDPQREEDGLRLDGCTGGEAFLGGADVTAFVPAAGDTGLEVRIRGAGLSLLFTLTRVPRADEPIASNNVALLWHQPGEGIHSDIWAEDGVVFAPRFDGRIELLGATSGEVLGVTSTPRYTGRSQSGAGCEGTRRSAVRSHRRRLEYSSSMSRSRPRRSSSANTAFSIPSGHPITSPISITYSCPPTEALYTR